MWDRKTGHVAFVWDVPPGRAADNSALTFDRKAAHGMRLDIPAGTAVRFEPGETKTVSLVAIAGRRVIRGGNNFAREYERQ